ncbi:MAG: hypothetical protein ACJA1C_002226 [Crocinitomicaceae bacterium]|jgi:hypothetical protein
MIREIFIFSIVLLCFVTGATAQLTKGQVYDYEVGDIHQKRGVFVGSGSGSISIQTDTVIFKSYSTGLDTITYHIKRLDHNSPVTPGGPPTNVQSVDTFIVTNLNQTAIHFLTNSCLPTTTEMYTDICGAYYERLSANYDSTCFEPTFWYSDLYSGLGGPYHYEVSVVNNYTVTWELLYYNTFQYGECGTPSEFAGLSKKKLSKIKPYPNPSQSGIFTIEGFVTVGEVQNISGATVEFSVKMNNGSTILNLENAPSGLYFISTTSSNGFKSTTKVILN